MAETLQQLKARIENLNKKAQTINTQSEGNRVRREVTVSTIEKLIGQLELPDGVVLDINNNNFSDVLTDLITKKQAKITADANKLEQVITASENGDVAQIEALTGIKIQNQEIKVPSLADINEKAYNMALETPASEEVAEEQVTTETTQTETTIEPEMTVDKTPNTEAVKQDAQATTQQPGINFSNMFSEESDANNDTQVDFGAAQPAEQPVETPAQQTQPTSDANAVDFAALFAEAEEVTSATEVETPKVAQTTSLDPAEQARATSAEPKTEAETIEESIAAQQAPDVSGAQEINDSFKDVEDWL